MFFTGHLVAGYRFCDAIQKPNLNLSITPNCFFELGFSLLIPTGASPALAEVGPLASNAQLLINTDSMYCKINPPCVPMKKGPSVRSWNFRV
jgi:hypothetical protein